jgi:hypothetical protein
MKQHRADETDCPQSDTRDQVLDSCLLMSKFWSSNRSDGSSSTASSDDSSSSASSSSDNDASDFGDWGNEDDGSATAPNQCDGSLGNDGIVNTFHILVEANDLFAEEDTSTQEKFKGEIFSAKSAALANSEDDPLDANLVWEQIKATQVFAPVPQSSLSSVNKRPDCTRIVCMSDTHGKHRDVPFLPRGDVLIHGGDFTKSGELGNVRDLSDYFGEHASKFDQIICIAGNHELTFQPEFYRTCKRRHKPNPFDPDETRAALKNCTYLEDSSTTIGEDNDIEVYGTPWTPEYYDWSFALPRGEALGEVYSKIPCSTDVLISHGPPLGRGDFTDHSGRAGCHHLLQHIQNRIRPRLNVYGHIHHGYGCSYDGQTLFVNASILEDEQAVHRCIVVDLPHDKNLPAMVVRPQCAIETMDEFRDWLERKGYEELRRYCSQQDINCTTIVFPLGNDLFEESAFFDICDALHLHRDKDAQMELRSALNQLYAESFW